MFYLFSASLSKYLDIHSKILSVIHRAMDSQSPCSQGRDVYHRLGRSPTSQTYIWKICKDLQGEFMVNVALTALGIEWAVVTAGA